jgi:hypothetical protein
LLYWQRKLSDTKKKKNGEKVDKRRWPPAPLLGQSFN